MRDPALLPGIFVACLAAAGFHPPLAAQAAFSRGDLNADRSLDVSDPIRLLLYLYAGSAAPACPSAGDANDDGALDTTDAVRLLAFVFSSGEPPAAPFPDCGPDATPDDLNCADHTPCVNRDPTIREWTVPWAGSRPRDPYVAADGLVWFVGQNADYAAFLNPGDGEFKRFDLPDGAAPHNLIVGATHVWYAGNGDAHIGKLDPTTGDIKVLAMPHPNADDPHTLVFDQGGDIWFTVQIGNFVGRLTTATEEVRLIPVPTANARPYGIKIDPQNRPWFVEFGTNKLAMIDREALTVREFTLPRSGTRPRRMGITSDGAIWYVDFAQGYLGRFTPADLQVKEWRAPSGGASQPYGMAVDHRDRIWFVESGPSPNRFVGFDPSTEHFFSEVDVPSGGGTIRHMFFDAPTNAIWFGTDVNTIGRAVVD